MDRRDELDERDRHPVEDLERRGEEDLRDRPAVPDVLEVGGRVTFEQGPQVGVLVPLRHADGEVAERVRADVDSPGEQAVALLRGERPIVPDDVAHRIGHRLLLSAAIVRRVCSERIRRPRARRGSRPRRLRAARPPVQASTSLENQVRIDQSGPNQVPKDQ